MKDLFFIAVVLMLICVPAICRARQGAASQWLFKIYNKESGGLMVGVPVTLQEHGRGFSRDLTESRHAIEWSCVDTEFHLATDIQLGILQYPPVSAVFQGEKKSDSLIEGKVLIITDRQDEESPLGTVIVVANFVAVRKD